MITERERKPLLVIIVTSFIRRILYIRGVKSGKEPSLTRGGYLTKEKNMEGKRKRIVDTGSLGSWKSLSW
jgi:hypothetical protein